MSSPSSTSSSTQPTARGTDGQEVRTLPKAKTSAAAAFALVLGLLAFFGTLSILFSPIALPLAVLGLVFGIVGTKRTKNPQRTGKALAVIGLVLSVLALLLAVAAVVGGFLLFDDPGAIGWMEDRLADVRENLPSEVPEP